MWDKVVWVHPVKRRFVVRTGLTGQTLTQELTGSQQRSVLAQGATHEEYAGLVQEHEGTEFVAEYDFSAEPTFRHGFNSFTVSVGGKRFVPAVREGVGGGENDSAGSYTYTPASAILT